MLEQVIPLNRTETAYQRLRADLLSGRVRPGTKLKIAGLSSSYDLNTSAVREALSRLASEGIVVSTPQRGFRAAPVSRKDLEDLTKARIAIETACLNAAIALGDLTWESDVVAAFYRIDRLSDVGVQGAGVSDSWASAHSMFHEALVRGCDNAWLLKIRDILFVQSERYRRLSIPNATVARDVGAEHRALMEAALARDSEKASALMAEHLNATMVLLLAGALSNVLSD